MAWWIWLLISLGCITLGAASCAFFFYAVFCSYDRREIIISGKDMARNKVEDWLTWYGLSFAILGVGIMGVVALNPWWGFAIGVGFIGAYICVQRFGECLRKL